MGKRKSIYGAYLETALQLFFNKYWLEPEKIGRLLADNVIETSKDVYPDSQLTNGIMLKIRKDWLSRMSTQFNSRIEEYIN